MEQTEGGEQGLSLPEEATPQQDVLVAGEGDVAGDTPVEAAPAAAQVDSVEEVQPEAPVVTAPPVASRAKVTVVPPVLTAEMPQSLLELEYQADSWSEISDAAGRKLAYGLVPAGKRLELRGEAPFKVFLGYASGVTVYYNGDLFDHTSFQSGDMARFRLGRAEHNRPASR
jgi:cytoskeleton protein RodZ